MLLQIPSPGRRLLAILLLALFSAPLLTPLLALTAGPDSRLPICCRRNGAHHCAASMQMDAQDSTLKLYPHPDRCPAYPLPSSPNPHTDLAIPTGSLLTTSITTHPASPYQAQARARVALDRARHKRGPPTLL